MKFILCFSVLVLNFSIFYGCKNNGETSQKKSLQVDSGYIKTPDSISLFYQKVGKGNKNLIVPLGFWLYDDFKHLADSLDYTIVFYDMRNRGRSGFVADSNSITMQQDAEDIETVRKHFGFEKISLIGESYLGFVVLLYAGKYTGIAENIIQIGSIPYRFGNTFPDSLQNKESQVDTSKRAELRKIFASDFASTNPEAFAREYWKHVSRIDLVSDTSFLDNLGSPWGGHLKYENEWMPRFVRHLNFHFQSYQALKLSVEDLKKISSRVLTIHGTKDRNAPFGSGKEWASVLPNARLLRVENAAHIPWIEQPHLVFNSIIIFLRGSWPDAATSIKP